MLYVTDQQHHVVVEIAKLHCEAPWREVSPAWPVGKLLMPAGIACVPDGRLIVVDCRHHRLVVLSPDRSKASVLAPKADAIGSLWRPTGVVLGVAGEVLIADTGNQRVVRCESLDTPLWSAYGTAGRGAGEFVSPTGIAADSMGRIMIADPGAGRVVRIDTMEGEGWIEIALPPAAAAPRPYGLAIGLGGILIADAGGSRVLLVSDDGAGGDSVTTLIDGAADASLLAPIAAVEWAGALLVADPAGASIAHFVPIGSESDGWRLASRLYGQPSSFPSPLFPRIGGFTVGPSS